jgi:hypothetical protein
VYVINQPFDGLLMVSYSVVHEWMAQANIIIFFGALVLIGLSLYLVKKRKWVWHGNSMIVVMLITSLLLVSHMGPSFILALNEALNTSNIIAVTGAIHGIIGAVGLVFGVWLVWVWSINESGSTQFCAPKKKLMWKILAIWILSLALGILYYVLHISFG